MLLGAPHLPNSMWGLADIHAGNVIDVLPQVEKGNKSPYEIRHKRKPNLGHLHLKVFGCPCQYSPIDGPEHKRASKTEWAYYVGIQWPMCMVYNPVEKKVLSVSRKKIVCHEGMYAMFDPAKSEVPKALFSEIDPTQPILTSEDPDENDQQDDEIEGVHSIKVLRESKVNESMNHTLPPPPVTMMEDPSSQSGNQGESINIPGHLDEDSLLEKIVQHKKMDKEELRTIYRQIVEAFKKYSSGKAIKSATLGKQK
jgi:hypothetical protein